MKPLALAIMMATTSGAMAQNMGFEDGTTTGWSGQGVSAVQSQTIQTQTNNWVVNPYGTYMGRLSITSGSFSDMVNGLSLSPTSISEIQTMLVTQAQVSGGGSNPTNAAWISRVVTLTAGQTFTLAWQYISTDYVPFNDGSIATLVKVGDPNVVATLNNYNSQYALLGFTNPGTGDYSTGSYGSTGWQTATFTAPADGDYILGFGLFNLADEILDPVLFVDEITGTTLKNGQTFNPIAPNPGTQAPNNSGPTLISNVIDTTAGTDQLNSGTITVSNGVINIMVDGATLTQLFDVQPGGMTIDQNSNSSTLGGVISGQGGVVIANSGSGGSITFTEVNTYTGPTTIDQGATLINDGSIASSSSVTNNGTFVNNGQASDVINNNDFTNSTNGTIASLVNTGTASNDGTITGTVTNSGTFTNAGTTGDWVNDGTVTNAGSMGNGTNNGTFDNSNTVGTVTNTGTFTNSETGVTSTVTNSSTGTFNNAGTTGDWENYGTVTNTGTMGNGTNYSVFTNNNTVGTVNNQGLFVNNGTAGDVTNSGVYVHVSGSVSNMTNSGIVDLSFISGPSSLGANYTQTSTGATIITGAQSFSIPGTATLAGNLTILDSPTTIGKYTYLTAGSIIGQFDSLTSNTGVLRYVGDTVQLWVMPDGTVVQAQVDRLASNLSGMNALASGTITGMVGSDCSMFGAYGYCLSVNYGVNKAASGDLASSGITVAKQLNQNWHVAMFGNKQLNEPTIGDIKFTSKTPSVGLTLGYRSNKEGYGLGGSVSYVRGSGDYTIGSDKTDVNGSAAQVRLTYGMPMSQKTTFIPYVGLRYKSFDMDGYTEQGPIFPLTFNSVRQSSIDLITGASVAHKFTDKLSGTVSAGLVQNLTYKAGAVSATSDMGDFTSNLSGKHYTSAALGTGFSYRIAKSQSVGVNFGWQQRSLTNASFASMGITYTIGF